MLGVIYAMVAVGFTLFFGVLDVIKFYDKGGEPNPYLDGGIVPLKLTDPEKQDLVAFMESLTGQGAGSPTRAELQDPAKKEASR